MSANVTQARGHRLRIAVDESAPSPAFFGFQTAPSSTRALAELMSANSRLNDSSMFRAPIAAAPPDPRIPLGADTRLPNAAEEKKMNATKQGATTSRRKKSAAQALTKGQPHSRDVCRARDRPEAGELPLPAPPAVSQGDPRHVPDVPFLPTRSCARERLVRSVSSREIAEGSRSGVTRPLASSISFMTGPR